MKQLIKDFTRQLSNAIAIADHANLQPVTEEIRNVIICGMGGSGIGGNMVAEITAGETEIPILVNKDYFLPHFVNRHSLVIISSYSGETEETITAYEQALGRNAHIVCITSGGKAEKMAREHKNNLILIPSGMPPRAAIGYSLVQILHILNFYNIIKTGYKYELYQAILLLDREEVNIKRDARETAIELEDKSIIIYGTAGMESAALRFSQQINENSKMLCSHNIFPELNHNELQGWKRINDNLAVVFFRNQSDYSRISRRINISMDIISNYNAYIKEVYSKGNSRIERLLYLVHWSDWVSYYLAERKGIDSMDIRVITYLKNQLAKV
jgi:glucose/mannose-6-phosphate isomerase